MIELERISELKTKLDGMKAPLNETVHLPLRMRATRVSQILS